MKQLYIHSTIYSTPKGSDSLDATGATISLGYYWDCSGRSPIETTWEYIGDEQGLTLALAMLRNDRDAEFMHVINRTVS